MMQDVRTENDALIEVARESARIAAGPVLVEPGKLYAFPTADGVQLLDLDEDTYTDRLPAPSRKTGTVVVEDIDSFSAYWNKHRDEGSEVYVDVDKRRLTAVLNAHTSEGPRWRDHTLVLQLKTTRTWSEWVAGDRKALAQQTFAEFVEDHLAEITEPSAADMLEIATTFQAKAKVSFSSVTSLSSGNRSLAFEEQTDATAGAKGRLEVPSHFRIVVKPLELPVPEGDDPLAYGIEARFRYRIDRGQLYVIYLLDDPAAVLRDAVLSVVAKVESDHGITVMRGTPA